MALSDALVKHCKPKSKAYTLKDIEGLALFVSPSGSKSWHFRFTLSGQRQRISFGVYPEVGLAEARLRCEANRSLVKQGVSPVSISVENHLSCVSAETDALAPVNQVVVSSVESFAAFSVRWKLFKFRKLGLDKTDKRQSTAVQIERYLRKHMLPVLGELPMDKIGKADVLRVLRGIEARGALSIAEKCRSWLFELFQHALAEGVIGSNPAAEMAVLALPKNPTQHNPFLLCHRSYPKLPISENTLNCGLKRLGYDGRLTGHGIRASLSTALNELDYPKQWIEAQLSHSDKDQIRASYNHAQYVEQRRQMMQDWADRLDEWQRQGFCEQVKVS